MSGMSTSLTLRLDRGFRALLVAWSSVVGLFILLFAIVAARHRPLLVLVPLVMLGLIAAWGWRWTQEAVIGTDTDLIIRNLLTTRRIPRQSIRGFRLGGSTLEYPGRAIRAVLDDGSTVVLAATGRYSAPSADHEARLAQLQEWRGVVHPALQGSDSAPS
jgi:hypothetical protein